MASSIEIPTIRSNGNQDENDAYLPDDEKEDYSPLVVGSDQPTIEGSVSASSSSSPVMILSLLDGYGQKIAIITCMVIVLIYGTVMILEGKNEKQTGGIQYSSNTVVTNMNTKMKYTKLQEMVSKFKLARTEYINKLKIDYGDDNYEKMFLDENKADRGAQMFQQSPGGMSEERFHRKAKIKILKSFFTDTDADATTNGVQFIWATGGHSAAAGHGNFFDESYTAYMSTVIKPVLQSIGVNFIGRPYAMGGTASAVEISICGKEIFGIDIDVLSWDFGMTDGSDYHNSLLYFYRASAYAKSVACIAFNTGNDGEHMKITKLLDEAGATALHGREDINAAVIDAIPDSFGLSDEEIGQMPTYVQSFRCEKQIERGDPYCDKMKWNGTFCPMRKHKTNWHPGWKWHAMMGNLMALYVIDVFAVSLEQLVQSTSTTADLNTLYQQYVKEESDDYNTFIHHEPPADYLAKFFAGSNYTDADKTAHLVEVIGSEPNFCRTARLPAEARFKGLVTESNLTGFKMYDHGIGLKEAATTENNGDYIRLTFDEEERNDCEVDAWLDFKDFFYISDKETAKKITIPNDAEIREYDPQNAYHDHLSGIIAFCVKLCDWGVCPNHVLKEDSIHDGKVEIEVNGQKASPNLIAIGHDCNLLQPASGGLQFTANEDGKFDVSVKVLEPNSYIRFSAIAVW